MVEEISILSLDDKDRWHAEIQAHGLPSQTWNYAHGLVASGIQPRLAVVRSGAGRMLVPFVERSWRGAVDIVTIPGLSGASVEPGSGAALSLWREFAMAQGWVAGYIQLAISADVKGTREEGELAAHNTVFVFDLDRWTPHGSVSRKFRQDKLYEGKRRHATLATDRDRLAEALIELYPEAMRMLGGSVAFPEETLRSWMRDPEAFALGAVVDGQIVAVHLGRQLGAHADWHISATSETGRSLGAWLVWNAAQQLRACGVRWFNIGGGKYVGDSVYLYKQRFNATPMPLRSLRQIYDAGRYAELCEQAGTTADGAWFPAYRRRPVSIVDGCAA